MNTRKWLDPFLPMMQRSANKALSNPRTAFSASELHVKLCKIKLLNYGYTKTNGLKRTKFIFKRWLYEIKIIVFCSPFKLFSISGCLSRENISRKEL